MKNHGNTLLTIVVASSLAGIILLGAINLFKTMNVGLSRIDRKTAGQTYESQIKAALNSASAMANTLNATGSTTLKTCINACVANSANCLTNSCPTVETVFELKDAADGTLIPMPDVNGPALVDERGKPCMGSNCRWRVSAQFKPLSNDTLRLHFNLTYAPPPNEKGVILKPIDWNADVSMTHFTGGTCEFVKRAGDTMTGPLTLSGAPVRTNDAANKAYVDAATGGGGCYGICWNLP